MKSAVFERPWGYKGKQVLGNPPTLSAVRSHVAEGCKCVCCESIRQWVARQIEKHIMS